MRFFFIGLGLTLFTIHSYGNNYETVVATMRKLQEDNPQIVVMFELGKNDQNQSIYGLKIQDPQLGVIPNLVVGVHHGNEALTADLSLEFVRQFIQIVRVSRSRDLGEYNSLKNRIFYVIPVLNISGYNANNRYETNALNNQIDPNRDYPDVCDTSKPNYQLSSTRNLAAFMEAAHIVSAITVHGYVGTFTFPWGYNTNNYHTKDEATYASVSSRAVTFNNYATGTHADLIYESPGTFEDWSYYTHGIWTNLVEMAHNPNIANDTMMMLTYFTHVPEFRSINNQATGSCTNPSRDWRYAYGRP